jgi:lipopolysaccharide assembly outer membrane protein LptD (OstA)
MPAKTFLWRHHGLPGLILAVFIAGLACCYTDTCASAQDAKNNPTPKLQVLTIQKAAGAQVAAPEAPDPAKVYKEWSISANKVETSDDTNRIIAHGSVRVAVRDQNSILFADDVVYDCATGIVDAVGHVAIVRDNQRTEGSRFKFKINSDEYLLTQANVYVGRPKMISRLSSSTGSIKLPSDRTALERFLDDDDSTGSDLDDLKNLFTGKSNRHAGSDKSR